MNEFGIRLLRPAPRSRIEFVREDAHGNRDGDTFGIEIPFAPILPIETGARKRSVRQPGDRDVVEDVVAREALGSPRQKRVRSARSCVRRDQGNKPQGRRGSLRFRKESVVAAPSGTRRRFLFDRRTAIARKRPSRRRRDPMAQAPLKKPPGQSRRGRCQACWCECQATPEALAHPSDRRRLRPSRRLARQISVSEAVHQRDPGACDAFRAPAGRGRFA